MTFSNKPKLFFNKIRQTIWIYLMSDCAFEADYISLISNILYIKQSSFLLQFQRSENLSAKVPTSSLCIPSYMIYVFPCLVLVHSLIQVLSRVADKISITSITFKLVNNARSGKQGWLNFTHWKRSISVFCLNVAHSFLSYYIFLSIRYVQLNIGIMKSLTQV